MFILQNDTTSYFSVSLKFGACYMASQWGGFKKKLCFIFSFTFLAFFVAVFHHFCVFMISISFFDKVSNFRNRILTNQNYELVVSDCQQNCMKKIFLQTLSFRQFKYFSFRLSKNFELTFILDCAFKDFAAICSKLA